MAPASFLLLAANNRMWDNGLVPVPQSAATAFGFIYTHPFQDGNGRVHRCLIHHVLAERKYTPPGMVFPVSSVMLDRIDDYCTTLQAHSAPLMDFIEWRPTQWGFERMPNGKYLAVTRPSFGPEYRSLVRYAKGDKDQDLPFPNLYV